MTKITGLSIVVPVYNEETRLPSTMQTLIEWIDQTPWNNEIVLVENGSTDKTWDLCQEYAAEDLRIFATQIQVDKPGTAKGAAIRHGVSMSAGDYIMIADADLSCPPIGWGSLLNSSADLVIGNRYDPGSNVHQPIRRKITGAIFSRLVRWLLPMLRYVPDTQCGFKLLKRDVALDLFDGLETSGWAYDVELAAAAVYNNYTIACPPIYWRHDDDSRISFVRDVPRMLADIWTVRRMYYKSTFDWRKLLFVTGHMALIYPIMRALIEGAYMLNWIETAGLVFLFGLATIWPMFIGSMISNLDNLRRDWRILAGIIAGLEIAFLLIQA